MGILKKFLRSKFNLSDKYQIDIYYTQREEAINDDFTLLDVTFIYSWNREKPLRLFYTVYEKPRRKRSLLTDRLRKLQSSPTKRPRLGQADLNDSAATTLPQKSSPPTCLSSVKKPGVGGPVSKPGEMSGAPSQQGARQKVKMKKTDFWKLHQREKLKVKRKSLEKVQKGGHGRKETMRTTPSPSKTGGLKDDPHPAQSESKINVKSCSDYVLNGDRTSKTPSGLPDSARNGVEPKVTVGNGNRPCSPRGQGKEGSSAVVAPVNGVCRPPLRTSLDSRSASPRLSTPGSSRSSSPRLPSVTTASPRPRAKSKPQVCGAREDGKLSGGRDGSRPCSRGSSRAESPRPAELQTVLHADRLPSLPVNEKISVDVSMTTSSASETSSDVTSPGAEDRANSGGLEEPGDFHGNGGHLCNVANFAPRPLPSLTHVHSNAHRQSTDKGSGQKLGVNAGTGYKPHVNKTIDSQSNKEKTNAHKPNADKGLKQSTNETTEVASKVNGHARDVAKDTGSGRSENKNHGQKQGLNKGGQTKDQIKPSKASQPQAKATNKTSNKKR